MIGLEVNASYCWLDLFMACFLLHNGKYLFGAAL